MKQLKDGKMKSLYKRNLIALYALLAFALFLFGSNLIFQFNYIRNYLSDGYELSSADLVSTVGNRVIEPQTVTGIESGLMTGYVGEPERFYNDYVYYNGRDYRFSVKIDTVTETGIYYEETLIPYFNMSSPQEFYDTIGAQDVPLERFVILTSGDLDFMTIIGYNKVVEPGDTVAVVFTRLGEYMVQDLGYALAQNGGQSYELLAYYADLRGVPVEYEDEDVRYAVGYGIIVLLTAFIALFFTFKPYSHPFYGQLLKYGGERDELIAQFDGEMADESKLTKKGKYYIGDIWMYKYSLFMNVIERNPDYVPEQQQEREEQRYKYKNQYRRYRGDGT